MTEEPDDPQGTQRLLFDLAYYIFRDALTPLSTGTMQPTIIAPTDRLSRHYSRRVEQILSRFNDIRELIAHEGSKGTRVEKEVRKFLIEFLPRRYEYGSGIVIDSTGGESDRSCQEDVLVLDKFFNPRLFLDEEDPAIYPVEVVYCGIEVKTSIDSAGFREAIENIASLKRLRFVKENYTYFHYNLPIVATTTGPLGFIFAFDTPSKKQKSSSLCLKIMEALISR